MKIYPRILEISNGSETSSFKIKNSSSDDKILLFKVRRAHPKLVSFKPKCGIVEPGFTKSIAVWLASSQVSTARVLVKFVAIPRRKLTTDWDINWATGCKRGVVKKIIEIRNASYDVSSSDMESTSSSHMSQEGDGIMDGSDDDIEEALASNAHKAMSYSLDSTMKHADDIMLSNSSIIFSAGTERVSPSGGQTKQNFMESNHRDEIHSDIGTRDHGCDLSVSLNLGDSLLDSDSDGKEGGAVAWKPPRQVPRDRSVEKWAAASAGMELMNEHNRSHLDKATEDVMGPDQKKQSIDDICWTSSQIQKLRTTRSSISGNSSQPSFVIQVFGESATDYIAGRCLGLRICALMDGDKPIVGIDVSSCPVKSIEYVIESICPLCTNQEERERCGQSDEYKMLRLSLEHDIQKMVAHRAEDDMSVAEYYRSHFFLGVKHLSFTNTVAKSISGTSLNRFENLVTLDLSNNYIHQMDSSLDLPALINLDISGNHLMNLDHLQGLSRLRSLNASANKLQTLHNSVHMLVPLAGHLISLDMSMNKVCENARYAEEVALLFPNIKYFDTVDMTYATGAYTSHVNITDMSQRLSRSFSKVNRTKERHEHRLSQSQLWRSSSNDIVIGDTGLERSGSPAPIMKQRRGSSPQSPLSFLAGSAVQPYKCDKPPALTSPEPHIVESNSLRKDRFRRAFSRASRFRMLRTQTRGGPVVSQHRPGDYESRFDDMCPTYQNPSYSVNMYSIPNTPHTRLKSSDLRSDSPVPDLPCEKDYAGLRFEREEGERSSSPAPKGYLRPTASAAMRYQSPVRDSHDLVFRHRTDRAEAEWSKSQKILEKERLKSRTVTSKQSVKKTKKIKTPRPRKVTQSLDSFVNDRRNIVADDETSHCTESSASEAIAWDRNFGISAKLENMQTSKTRSPPRRGVFTLANSMDTLRDNEISGMEQRITEAVVAAIEESLHGPSRSDQQNFGIVNMESRLNTHHLVSEEIVASTAISGRSGRYCNADDINAISGVSLSEPALSRGHCESSRPTKQHSADPVHVSIDTPSRSQHDFDNYVSFERWLHTDGDPVSNTGAAGENEIRNVSIPPPGKSFVPYRRVISAPLLKTGIGVPAPQNTHESKIPSRVADVTFYSLPESLDENIRLPVLGKNVPADGVDDSGSVESDCRSEGDSCQLSGCATDNQSAQTDGALEAYLRWLENHTVEHHADNVADEHTSSEVKPDDEQIVPIDSFAAIASPVPLTANESPVPTVRHPRVSASTPYQPLSPHGKKSPGGFRAQSRNPLWKLMSTE